MLAEEVADESPGSSTSLGTIRGRPGHVGKVKATWRTHEDFCLAHNMQEKEFEQHFGKNKSERRIMQGDIKVTKEEQKMEDLYAEEYWEQVRRDREAEDARIAMELQCKLAEEEERKLKQIQARDEELARRYQAKETKRQQRTSKKASPASTMTSLASDSRMQEMEMEDERVARELQEYLKLSTSKDSVPQAPIGVSQSAWNDILNAKSEGREIVLPPGMSPEQQVAITEALKEEDSRLAQEAQDFELAQYLQKQEEMKRKRLRPQEQIDNDMNQATSSLSSAAVPAKPDRQTAPGGLVGDLITFEDEDSDPDPPPDYAKVVNCAPARPPPPRRSSKDANSTQRDLAAIGGIQVLPQSRR